MGHVKSHFSWVTNITRIIQTGSYLIHDAKITTKSEFCQMVSFSIHSPSTFDIASKKPRALVYSVPIRPRLKTMKDNLYGKTHFLLQTLASIARYANVLIILMLFVT